MKRIIIACTLLAGCGGAGGNTAAPNAQALDFDALHAGVLAQGVTPVSFIPTNGSHSYAGLMQLNLPLGDTPAEIYEGEFAVSLAFGGGGVAATGTVDGFAGESGNELGGALAFDGGLLLLTADPDRDFLMFADIDGALIYDGASYDVAGQIAADFYGMNVDGFAGRVFAGTISDGTNLDIFDGAFAGDKLP